MRFLYNALRSCVNPGQIVRTLVILLTSSNITRHRRQTRHDIESSGIRRPKKTGVGLKASNAGDSDDDDDDNRAVVLCGRENLTKSTVTLTANNSCR